MDVSDECAAWRSGSRLGCPDPGRPGRATRHGRGSVRRAADRRASSPTRGSRGRSSTRRPSPSSSPASARSACCSRSWCARSRPASYQLVMGERRWRASREAGLDDRASHHPRHHRRRTCCATRCWRTCIASSSTRWKRRRPTSSCWRSSARRTTSSPIGSVGRGRRSSTRSGCSACRRRCSGGWPPGCSARATPGRCSRCPTPTQQERLAARIVAEGLRCEPPRSSSLPARRPAGSAPGRPRAPQAPALADLAASLSDLLETRVTIELGRRQGKLTVEFAITGRSATRRRCYGARGRLAGVAPTVSPDLTARRRTDRWRDRCAGARLPLRDLRRSRRLPRSA